MNREYENMLLTQIEALKTRIKERDEEIRELKELVDMQLRRRPQVTKFINHEPSELPGSCL
jgi:hypothetical protein